MAGRRAVGVLLMAYGTPERPEDVEAYLAHIRGGRRPPPEAVRELQERYRRIGGRSPLTEITRAQARALQRRLEETAAGGTGFRVFVGMRHWRPWIQETVAAEIGPAGVDPLVALVLAPHYSRMGVGAYFDRLREALGELEAPPQLLPVEHYHDHPAFVAAAAEVVGEGLAAFRRGRGTGSEVTAEQVTVVFTAHSLPARILEEDDPYPRQLLASCRLLAEACGGLDWELAYQSASPTGEAWLGPDLLDLLPRLAAEGRRRVLVAPIGFVADHLEVLYDVDVECREAARALGLRLRRCPSLNDRPAFIDALAAVVRERLEAGA